MVLRIGFSDVWFYQNVSNVPMFFHIFETRLKDVFPQERDECIYISSKWYLYIYIMIDSHNIHYFTKYVHIKIMFFLTQYILVKTSNRTLYIHEYNGV